MRLFLAVELEPALAGALGRVSDHLQRRVEARAPRARVTWVPEERLHLTIRFIGEVDGARGSAIAAALAGPLTSPSFDLTVSGVGTFPRSGPPRVIWAGIGAGRDAMVELEREVSGRLAALDVPSEARPYRPHLTLARVRDAAGLQAGDVCEGGPTGTIGTMHVRAITLFQSRLSPKGPVYVPLQHTLVGEPESPPLREL